jgi:hypothetical protein
LCIESGYVEWHAFTVAAILKSNMAATWRPRRWHHSIGRIQKPRYATWIMLLWPKKRFGVGLEWRPYLHSRWRPLEGAFSVAPVLCANGAFIPICTILLIFYLIGWTSSSMENSRSFIKMQ